MNGVRLEMASKSSMESAMSISRAMAIRCRTALVDPPLAATLAMVFSMDLRVMICEGRRLARTASMSMRPASRVAAYLSFAVAGTPESCMGEMPRISPLMAMVLAVNWPPHAPAPGQALASRASSPASSILPGGVSADAFEDVLDGDVDAVQLAGSDGAAVEHDARDIEAAERHDDAGHVLVAAADADEAVEEIAAGNEFDGVGDHFARDQRGLHALRAHRDAVGDGDGVELHRRAAGLANAFLQGLGDFAQMHVAGADLGPGVGDADDGLVQIVF